MDTDWGANNNGTFKGDQPYGDFSATNGGNGGQQDASDCAVLRSYSANGNSGVSTKLHVDGMIYAPSAAVDLAGNDNDSSFASDGIYVRQLSALRWRNGGTTPFIGGRSTVQNPRKVVIQICVQGSKCLGSNSVLVRAVVQYNDQLGVLPDAGQTMQILSWIRKPNS
jgi:hypothetical protein